MFSEAVTLLIIWAVAVVAFFVLWALLAKVIKRISERKQMSNTPQEATGNDAASIDNNGPSDIASGNKE